jgi:hypothetical protein
MTRTRWILVVVAALFVAAAVAVVVAIPTDDPPERFVVDESGEDAAVTVVLNIDSIDANRNVIRVRIRVIPGAEFPDEGVTLTTTADALPVVELERGELPPETVVELGTARGDVSDYPFDRYRADIQLAALRGTGDALETSTELLPVTLVGIASAAGYSIEGRADPILAEAADEVDPDSAGLVAALELEASRDQNVRVWALAMMAINWVLALAAVAVTASVVLGDRAWESRHLAWLGSMLFALAAFRNTAPGNPIIGTFLDFYAFFPAEAIITLCLGALVTSYLLRSRDQLQL